MICAVVILVITNPLLLDSSAIQPPSLSIGQEVSSLRFPLPSALPRSVIPTIVLRAVPTVLAGFTQIGGYSMVTVIIFFSPVGVANSTLTALLFPF